MSKRTERATNKLVRRTVGGALGGARGAAKGALIGSVGNALIEKARGKDWKDGAIQGAKWGAVVGGATGVPSGVVDGEIGRIYSKKYNEQILKNASYLRGAAVGSVLGYGAQRLRGKDHQEALEGAAIGGLAGMGAGSLRKTYKRNKNKEQLAQGQIDAIRRFVNYKIKKKGV